MKKYIILILAILLSISIKSQDKEASNKIYFKFGRSTYSGYPSVFGFDILSFEESINRNPVLQFQYQRDFGSWFELGFAITNQHFSYVNPAHKPTYSSGIINVDYKLNRLNFSVNTIANYYRDDNVKLYSGIRNGLTFWLSKSIINNKTQSTYLPVKWQQNVYYAPQIILLGIDFKIVKTFGGNVEFAFGSPYYFLFGIHYEI